MRMRDRNRLKRNSVSRGSPFASGWNCTLQGLQAWMMPSFERSLALRMKGFQLAPSVASYTVKPWFCGVIAAVPGVIAAAA